MNSDDLTPEERIERAATAKRLLSDPVLTQAFDSARSEVVKKWLEADKPDHEDARTAWAVNKALDLVHDDLRRVISAGEIAAHLRRTQ